MATRVSCGAAEITSSFDMKTPRGHRRVREPGAKAGHVFGSCESGASGSGLVPRVHFKLQVPRPGCSRAFFRARSEERRVGKACRCWGVGVEQATERRS